MVNNTTYGGGLGGNVNAQTFAGAYPQAQGFQMPQLLPNGGWPVNSPRGMQMNALQSPAERSGQADEAAMRKLQLQAMQEDMRGTPNYVKMVGQGAQGIPGYIQAQAGEPGAVFAGYLPRNAKQGPSSSSFQPGGSHGTPATADSSTFHLGGNDIGTTTGAPDPGAEFRKAQMQNALQRSDAEYAAGRKKADPSYQAENAGWAMYGGKG